MPYVQATASRAVRMWAGTCKEMFACAVGLGSGVDDLDDGPRARRETKRKAMRGVERLADPPDVSARRQRHVKRRVRAADAQRVAQRGTGRLEQPSQPWLIGRHLLHAEQVDL